MEDKLEIGHMIPNLLETLDVKIGCLDKALATMEHMLDLEIELKTKINLLEAENQKLKDERSRHCDCNK